MQNTININPGGRIICIHNNAWQMQLAYIETLYRYFKDEEGCFEIINDIESRIAELMQDMTHTQHAPISVPDMKRIIQVMGTADQFKELDADDWDIVITSTEHCTIDSSGTIISGFNLNQNAPSCSEESKLCYN